MPLGNILSYTLLLYKIATCFPFLDGYKFAMICDNKKYKINQYHEFNEWLAQKYHIRESILWDDYLIRFVQNESEAFDLFYDELEAFLKENNIEIPNVQ